MRAESDMTSVICGDSSTHQLVCREAMFVFNQSAQNSLFAAKRRKESSRTCNVR